MANLSSNSFSNASNNSSSDYYSDGSQQEIGGILYFIAYLSTYLPYVILCSFGVVIGFFGNILIIGAVICTKELHTTTNMLVFNLAAADLIISSFVDLFTVIGVFLGGQFFDQRIGLCRFVAAVCLIACETSLMNIGFLAFNRYINICYHKYYAKIFTKQKTIIYCIITWLIGVAITLPNVFGWGGFYYDLKTLNCVWDRLASQSYSIFFPMSSIVLPCCCIFFFYIRIFLYARNAKLKVMNTGAMPMKNSKGNDMSKSLRIAKGLFASFMLFTICWMPYGVIVMSDYGDHLPRTAHMFSMAAAHLNSSMNPLLYAICNPLFQKGYANFIKRLMCKTNPGESHSTTEGSTAKHMMSTIRSHSFSATAT